MILGPFGPVGIPDALSQNLGDVDTGIGTILNISFRTLIVVAGIYALFNFIIAGYMFLSAGGDPQKIANASAKIWQSILGLVVAAGAFVIMAIVSQLLFGSYDYLLNPVIPTADSL